MKRRNAPGEGSITKRKSDGLYMVRWPRPGQPPGCEYARTLREAQQKLRAAITRRDAGLPEPDRRLTVGRFLEDWLENTCKPSVRPTTFKSYESLTRVHLIPAFSHIKLAELTPRDVQSHLARMQADGLSPRSVQYQRAILRRALNHALKWGMVSRNVAALTDAPRMERADPKGLSPDRVRALLKAAKGTGHEALIYTTLTFGLRAGEALGLRWEDVDLDRGVLTVQGQVQRIEGKVQWLPRTKRGQARSVPIPAPLVSMLKEHRQAQRIWRAAHADRWQENGLVFPTRRGLPKEPRMFNRHLEDLCRGAKLEKVSPHQLRHTTVSFLRSLHVPDSVIMAIVGHSTQAQTRQYGDVLQDLKAEAMDKVGGLLFGG